MTAYYNEIDPKAAAWIRELINAQLIPQGDVDERSIEDVTPNELRSYTQHHFFAGISGWAYALRLASWPDDRPVWTGSPPCQPLSSAGKGKGVADDRHLWPAFFWHIQQLRPRTIFGEQVASKATLNWWDIVADDLEGAGYACAAVDLPAASVGAPHLRHRLFWVANANGARQRRQGQAQPEGWECAAFSPRPSSGKCLANAEGTECKRARDSWSGRDGSANCGCMEHPHGKRQQEQRVGVSNNHWGQVEWIPCLDGKTRPVKPGLRLLADGVSECLDRMRSIEQQAIQKVEKYASSTKSDTDKVLSELRQALQQEAREKKQHSRVCLKLHEAEVLIAFLLCISAARTSSKNKSGFEEACEHTRKNFLRVLWSKQRTGCSSLGRESIQQQARQPANPMQVLSCVLASHARSYQIEARAAHASSCRVAAIKGYGNAIVPQVAAEFIRAFLDSELEGLTEVAV